MKERILFLLKKVSDKEMTYEEASQHVSDLFKDNNSNIISDGFGSTWSLICPECGRKSMQVVRPSKAQCKYCG